MEQDELEKTVEALIGAVNTEREAAHARAALEVKVYEAIGIKAGDMVMKRAGKFNVTVANSLDYALNWPLLDKAALPKELLPVKVEKVLDREALAWLRDNNQDAYKRVLSCLKVTPGRTNIHIDAADTAEGQNQSGAGA